MQTGGLAPLSLIPLFSHAQPTHVLPLATGLISRGLASPH